MRAFGLGYGFGFGYGANVVVAEPGGGTPITSIDELEAFLVANAITIDQFEAKLVTLGYDIDTLEAMIEAGTLTEEEILSA